MVGSETHLTMFCGPNVFFIKIEWYAKFSEFSEE